jgi:cell division protein FtsB
MVSRTALVLAHVVFALLVIGLLYRQYDERERDVTEKRRIAAEEHRETERLQSENQIQQGLLRGLRANDPYVVELLAREKLRYTRSGELMPPPRPVETDTAPTAK